jgi:outer membrane protein
MKRFGVLLTALFFCSMTSSTFAEQAKIGVVDLQKIMQTSNQMKDIQQKLEQKFKPRRDLLVEAESHLKSDMERFKRDSAIMTSAQKKELEKKILTAQQKFERDGQQYQQELSTAHNEAMEGLYTKVRSAINKIAKEAHYDLIVQKDAAPFSVPSLDVTDNVMKAIN